MLVVAPSAGAEWTNQWHRRGPEGDIAHQIGVDQVSLRPLPASTRAALAGSGADHAGRPEGIEEFDGFE